MANRAVLQQERELATSVGTIEMLKFGGVGASNHAFSCPRHFNSQRQFCQTRDSYHSLRESPVISGAAGGYAGVQLLNHFSPGFRALPPTPIKAALVIMSAIGCGALFSEQAVTRLARGEISSRQAQEQQSSMMDAFHQHKVKAIGLLCALYPRDYLLLYSPSSHPTVQGPGRLPRRSTRAT